MDYYKTIHYVLDVSKPIQNSSLKSQAYIRMILFLLYSQADQ